MSNPSLTPAPVATITLATPVAVATKTNPASTMETGIQTFVNLLQACLADAATLQWYSDRNVKPADVQTLITACAAFNNLVVAASSKTVK